MPEIRDPAIKLFGKTIALQAAETGGGGGGGEKEEDKGHLTSKDSEQESQDSKGSSEPVSSAEYEKGNHSSSDDQETAPENDSKPEEEEDDDEQNDSSKPILKKPDKILSCPRCNSLDTKFCYYNNYNVNQPRHFCKNCQRYWTAGGTMRNVPVGAGRRKNKSSVASSLYHHLTVSDVGLQAIPEQVHRPPLRSSGTVLSFGNSDAPFCDTMASVLDLPKKTTISCHRNGVHPAEEHMEEQSSVPPAVTPSNCNGIGGDVNVPCQYPWATPPALCASSYAMPFYPAAAAYWGYINPWSLPLLASPVSGWSVSRPDCPALGKHSREEDDIPGDSSSSSSERRHRLWIPKTLRMDDPGEAAKSSIWASMGFKSDDGGGGGKGFFKTFQKKGGELITRTHLGHEASSQALHANPAALSRSINFLESS